MACPPCPLGTCQGEPVQGALGASTVTKRQHRVLRLMQPKVLQAGNASACAGGVCSQCDRALQQRLSRSPAAAGLGTHHFAGGVGPA